MAPFFVYTYVYGLFKSAQHTAMYLCMKLKVPVTMALVTLNNLAMESEEHDKCVGPNVERDRLAFVDCFLM